MSLMIRCLFLLVVLASTQALAQPKDGPRRMGVLVSGSEITHARFINELKDGLRENGYVDGKNINLSTRYANGEIGKMPALAAELVRDRVDLIFAGGDQAVLAVKGATQTIPIVMVACDALAAGLITNLARPGGNLTGVTCINSDLAAKRFELMAALVPSAKVMAIILNRDDPRMRAELVRTDEASRATGVKLLPLAVRALPDIPAAFKDASDAGAKGVIVVFDSFTFFNRKRMAEAAIATRTPTIFNFREYVEAGGLISYGPSLGLMYRQAMGFVDQIVKGANPGELSVQQPTKFELVINRKTANSIGITLPEALLLKADQVID